MITALIASKRLCANKELTNNYRGNNVTGVTVTGVAKTGSYWERDGGNEIDIVAVNDAEKRC